MNNGEKGAFACETNAKWNLGLTKREYMAGLAMQGLLTRNPRRANGETDLGILESKRIVEESVIIADELLKQLES